MSYDLVLEKAKNLSSDAAHLASGLRDLESYAASAKRMANATIEAAASGHSSFVMGLTVFMLAVFVGYYVVWKVTPALHSPLMAVTNAISSVIIIGALWAAGLEAGGFAKTMGFLAVILAGINIFGGFIVTYRMVQMFTSRRKKPEIKDPS
jgi:NAD(P) transhydrogenase subunit alpha